MKNISSFLKDVYRPVKALIVFGKGESGLNDVYVESYDMDIQGTPINAHPLSGRECAALAHALRTEENNKAFLKCKGILPKNLLYLSGGDKGNGCAIWHTHVQTRSLFFRGLDIPDGEANVPPLVWRATKDRLQVWALKNNRVTAETPLYRAPFFNLYRDATVCMGNVDIEADSTDCLERFMAFWEQAFWNSAFSHLIDHNIPIEGDLEALWRELITSGKRFPASRMKKTTLTLKNLWK